jgi:TrwC relaxase
MTACYFEVVLSPKTQTNLKNAKGYFEEHLSVGDYYAENERVPGEWMGKGAELLGYPAQSRGINSWRFARISIRRRVGF